jgi:hypothetical protein
MQGDKYYHRLKTAGRASNFIWSVTVMVIVVILLVVAFELLKPWFEVLMEQI